MTEAEFHDLWLTTYDKDLSPLDLLSKTASLTSSPAQIFIAGYQAAIRATFPDIQYKGWLSFAVSESKTKEGQNPARLENGKLYGEKSWLAGANHLGNIIVKVGRGSEAKYVLVDTDNDVVMRLNPAPKFLSQLSQASISFNASETISVNASLVKNFSTNEAFYIYHGLLNSLIKQFDNDQANIKTRADSIAKKYHDPSTQLVALDSEVQALVQDINKLKLEQVHNWGGEYWETDKRLFSMYSSNIQAKA